MKERRFGRTIKLPSTLQLKHQILMSQLEELLRLEKLEADSMVETPRLPNVDHPIVTGTVGP